MILCIFPLVLMYTISDRIVRGKHIGFTNTLLEGIFISLYIGSKLYWICLLSAVLFFLCKLGFLIQYYGYTCQSQGNTRKETLVS